MRLLDGNQTTLVLDATVFYRLRNKADDGGGVRGEFLPDRVQTEVALPQSSAHRVPSNRWIGLQTTYTRGLYACDGCGHRWISS